MVFALHALLDELRQQSFQNVRAILHLALERDHDEARDVDAVAHREVSIALERPHEQQQERLVHDELAKEPEALVLAHQVLPVPLEYRVVRHAREQDLHGVGPVVQEGYATAGQVARQVRHLRLQLGEGLLAFRRDAQLQDVHLLLHVLQDAVRLGGLASVRDEEADEDDHQEETGRYDPDQGWLLEGPVQGRWSLVAELADFVPGDANIIIALAFF